MWDRRKKKVAFYAVVNKNEPNQFLTFTCSKKDAVEFCYKFLRIKHFEHFKMWCELRNLKPDSDDAWTEYFNKVIDYKEKAEYLIAKKVYELNNLGAILRMFGGCFPLGCSFDTETEYNYLKFKLESQQQAMKRVQKQVEEIVKNETAKETEQNGK